jgi:hypothetical protein
LYQLKKTPENGVRVNRSMRDLAFCARGRCSVMPSSVAGRQRIILGGGYGAPLDRDPRKVSDDVPDGFITVDYARDEYGVVLDDYVVLSEVETGRP